MSAPPSPPVQGDRLAAVVCCCVLALAWAIPVSMERSWGYDESMHAELPALRMALAANGGDFAAAYGALLDCERYPFVYPVLLAAVQLVTGPSELACRVTGRLLWAAACFVIFLLAREAARDLQRGRDLAPWLALLLAATSPLALAYAGTLFLEIPFALAASLALYAWVRRDGSARRDVAAGAWLALAFFTKFNYGALLLVAAAIDLALERRPLRAARVALVPAVLGLWWFVLARGAGHRAAFWAFVTENTDASMATGWDRRIADWGAYFTLSPVVLVLLVAGVLRTLPGAPRAATRMLWVTALVFVAALSLHPFHLERFYIAAGPALWCLGGIGLAQLAPRAPLRRTLAAVVTVVLVSLTAPMTTTGLAWTVGFPTQIESVQHMLARRRSLDAGAELASTGLLRDDNERILDLVAGALGPAESFGWLGVSTQLPRGALHAGLVRRGGAPERLLRDAHVPMFIETPLADPGLGEAALKAWGERYDVILHSSPVDLLDHGGRRFMQRYVDLLHAGGGWTCEPLGTLDLTRNDGSTLAVTLFACRRSP